MALSYKALISTDELSLASHGSLGKAVTDALNNGDAGIRSAIEDAIEDVTRDIETFLKRQLIVHRRTLRLCAADWKARSGFNNALNDPLQVLFAPLWPVVQILSVDGDSTAETLARFTIHNGEDEPGRYIAYDPQELNTLDIPTNITAYVGYRRVDQSVTGGSGSGDPLDINDFDSTLSSLTEEPDELHWDMRRTAKRLAEADILQAAQGLLGISRTTKRVDRLEVDNVNTIDYRFRERELNRLSKYRRMII